MGWCLEAWVGECVATALPQRPASSFDHPLLPASWRPPRTAPSLQGDPSAVPYAVENAKQILGKKPVFGICMGHQVLGQAFGGKTFKLKFGHHGGNHPLRHTPTGAPHARHAATPCLPAGGCVSRACGVPGAGLMRFCRCCCC